MAPPQGNRTKQILGSNSVLVGGGATTYNSIWGTLWDATEADATITAPHSGRVILIRAVSTGNSATQDVTVSVKVNTTVEAGGAVLSATTNEESDSTSIVEFAKGDDLVFVEIGAGSGTIIIHFLAIIEWYDD